MLRQYSGVQTESASKTAEQLICSLRFADTLQFSTEQPTERGTHTNGNGKGAIVLQHTPRTHPGTSEIGTGVHLHRPAASHAQCRQQHLRTHLPLPQHHTTTRAHVPSRENGTVMCLQGSGQRQLCMQSTARRGSCNQAGMCQTGVDACIQGSNTMADSVPIWPAPNILSTYYSSVALQAR